MATKKNITYRVSVTDRFTKPLRRMQAQLESFKRTAEKVDNMDVTPNVDADTKVAEHQLKQVERQAKAIPNTVHVNVFAKGWKQSMKEIDRFNQKVDGIADKIRNFSVVMQSMFSGLIKTSIPMMVSGIGILAAGIGNLGPVIGTMTGGLMGMASSMGLAAGAAAGLIGFTIPLANDLKTADAAIQAGEASINDYTGSMRNALEALSGMRSQLNQTKEAMAPAVYEMMAGAFENFRLIVNRVEDGLVGTAEAAGSLMDRLNGVITSAPDVEALFAWFNERGPQAFENWGIIAGNTIRGVLNLLRAFDPLAQTVEEGLIGMTERFAEWSAKLDESQKFKDFVAYVQENGPKLVSIVGNIVGGLVGMFSAFAPLSADMLTSFEQMTAKFKEWGESLAENEGFKTFISYVRENTPAMIDLIGNLTTFLIELGQGFADVGAFMMPLVSRFMEFATWLLQTYPLVGKLIAGLPVLIGIFKMLVFPIQLVIGAFRILSPLFSTIIGVFTRFGGAILRVLPIIGRIGTTLLTMSNPVTLVISMVILLATVIIANWDKIKAWTQQAWSAVKSYTAQAWAAVKAKIFEVATSIAAWVLTKFEQMKSTVSNAWNAVKNFTSQAWSAIKSKVSEATSNLVNTVRTKFQEAKSAVTNKMNEIKSQIKQAWENAVNTAKTKITSLLTSVRSGFSDMLMAVREKMQDIKQKIIDLWNQAKDFLSGGVSDMVGIGKDLIGGFLDGIKEKGEEVIEAAKGIAEKAVNIVRKALDIHSPSRVMMGIGGYVGEGLAIGIEKMHTPVERAATKLANAVNKPFDKIDSDRRFSVSTYANTYGDGLDKSIGKARNSNGANADSTAEQKANKERNNNDKPMYATLNIGGYEARALIQYFTEEQELNAQLARGGR